MSAGLSQVKNEKWVGLLVKETTDDTQEMAIEY